ncbi:MAG TPA: DUF2877 domain-containing protein [Euzebyales bacterium]
MTEVTTLGRPPDPTAGADAAAASRWLRPLLVGPARNVQLVGTSGPAWYVRCDDGTVIAVEAHGGVRLPNSLTVGAGAGGLADVPIGRRGDVGNSGLRVGGRTLVVRRWWDPTPRVGPVGRDQLRRRRASLPSTGVPGDDAFGVRAGVRRLAAAAMRHDLSALGPAVAELIGRGAGSTPAGDDVVAGALAALRVLGTGATAPVADALARHSRRHAHHTTALSSTLLRCADDAAVVGAAGRVLRALAGQGRLDGAVTALTRIGHTSGQDLLAGITIAVDVLTSERIEG